MIVVKATSLVTVGRTLEARHRSFQSSASLHDAGAIVRLTADVLADLRSRMG